MAEKLRVRFAESSPNPFSLEQLTEKATQAINALRDLELPNGTRVKDCGSVTIAPKNKKRRLGDGYVNRDPVTAITVRSDGLIALRIDEVNPEPQQTQYGIATESYRIVEIYTHESEPLIVIPSFAETNQPVRLPLAEVDRKHLEPIAAVADMLTTTEMRIVGFNQMIDPLRGY